MSRCWCTSNPSHCQLSPVCLCERARYLCGRWKSHLQILSYQIPILHFSNTSIKVTIISCCHASLSSQQNLQLLHFFKVIFILSIICEIIFNFDKQHDTVKSYLQRPKQVQHREDTVPRNLKKKPATSDKKPPPRRQPKFNTRSSPRSVLKSFSVI